MKIDRQVAPFSDWQADAVLFFAFEESTESPLPGFERWIRESGSWIMQSRAFKDFEGKADQVTVLYAPVDYSGISKVMVLGLGPRDKFDLDKFRSAVSAGFRKCRENRVTKPGLPLCAFDGLPLETPAVALQEALLSATLSLYRYDAFKTKNQEQPSGPESLLLLSEREPDEALRDALAYAQAVASGVRLARDLTAAPANEATPAFMANTATQLADRFGFGLRVIDFDEALSLGMGAFTAVAKGSREPASFIILEYSPPGAAEAPPFILIGKGITFDTGGISLKSSDGMVSMKQDMAGAAAVMGVFETLGRLNADERLRIGKHIVGVMPCTENMPDGQAYKPGDVLKTLSGLTVEVISTDAEGRLILADALTYAANTFKPAAVVDIATLTGACVAALGERVAAVIGNRESLSRSIQEIGMQVGERFWPLPLWDFFFDSLKGDVADLKNVGDRKAGTIIAAMFLKQFVSDDIPWAHLDIAGTAWSDKDLPAVPKGATGFGVRTLVELLRLWPGRD